MKKGLYYIKVGPVQVINTYHLLNSPSDKIHGILFHKDTQEVKSKCSLMIINNGYVRLKYELKAKCHEVKRVSRLGLSVRSTDHQDKKLWFLGLIRLPSSQTRLRKDEPYQYL